MLINALVQMAQGNQTSGVYSHDAV